MRGADQCPKCGSRKWIDRQQHITDFYAETIRCCANCKTAWEPFDEAELLDTDDRYSSFIEPCNNCAFRKGSPESRDKEGFAAMREKLDWHNSFYCHKAVPITPGNGYGFDYPDPVKERRKLRLCRGYLNTLKFPEQEEK